MAAIDSPRLFTVADHKVGHTLLGNIAETMSRVADIRITHQIFYRFASAANPRDKWVAIMRHPFEIVTSGYRYHLVCKEPWALGPGISFYDGTIKGAHRMYPEANFSEDTPYQRRLMELATNDGLEHELRTVGRLTIEAMYYWRYWNDLNVLAVKYEDFEQDFNGTVRKMARFYGIEELMVVKVVRACRIHDMKRRSDSDIAKNPHITNKKRMPFVYKKLWKPHHYNVASELFPADVLSKFGYCR